MIVARFEVLMMVLLIMQIIWDVVVCRLFNISEGFERSYCLCFQGKTLSNNNLLVDRVLHPS